MHRAAVFSVLSVALWFTSGCTSMKPADIYPHMPPNSSFERKITTVWGQTEVNYKTGNFDPAGAPSANP